MWLPALVAGTRAGCQWLPGTQGCPWQLCWEPAGWVAVGLQKSMSKLPGFLALNFALYSHWCQS